MRTVCIETVAFVVVRVWYLACCFVVEFRVLCLWFGYFVCVYVLVLFCRLWFVCFMVLWCCVLRQVCFALFLYVCYFDFGLIGIACLLCLFALF